MGFLHRPLVVLLDEPLVSLDDAGGESLARAVGELRSYGGALLWCSPTDADGPLDVDDRLVLEAGRVVSSVPAANGVMAR
jgi:ABC-type protease/lipase transport system fused ATPase/permease subunit